jgi:hypothetical protein
MFKTMLHRGLDFQTVRVLCKHCGWFRNIAHSGCADGKRALVKITQSQDGSHVLHGEVIEVHEDSDVAIELEKHPGFRDLEREAQQKGLLAMERTFAPLLKDQTCPRCKTHGHLEVSQIKNSGSHVRY